MRRFSYHVQDLIYVVHEKINQWRSYSTRIPAGKKTLRGEDASTVLTVVKFKKRTLSEAFAGEGNGINIVVEN
jgi:hypothetical protein